MLLAGDRCRVDLVGLFVTGVDASAKGGRVAIPLIARRRCRFRRRAHVHCRGVPPTRASRRNPSPRACFCCRLIEAD